MLLEDQRKAMANQVFIYAAAGIIVVIVLLFGYQAIAGLQNQTETATLVTFKTELQGLVKETTQYGKDQRASLPVPRKVNMVCVAAQSNDCSVLSCSESNCADSSYENNVGYNVLLDIIDSATADTSDAETNLVLSGENYLETMSVQGLSTGSCAITCIEPTAGTLNFRLQGLGTRTRIILP